MEEEKAIDLLWDEWKYRHELFWQSLFRWAGSVITLWIIPFLKPDVFKSLPSAALLFPSLAFVLSFISAWLLGAEQRRFEMVNIKYKELRGSFSPPNMPTKGFSDRLFAKRIGALVVWLYGLAFAIISVVDGVLLWRFLKG